MITDARGLELSESDRDALEAIDAFSSKLLRLENGVEVILDASKQAPGSQMALLYSAAFHLFAQTNDATRNAAELLSKFDPDATNDRGRMLHRALVLWAQNQFLNAAAALEEITRKFPADLLVAKFAEFLYYVLGQQHMGTRFRAHMTRIEAANCDDPDFLGMKAFACELCGDFSAAEKTAERSLEIEGRNPWAQHALSHVLIRAGRIEEGKARLDAFLPELRNFQRLIHSHDSWHLALLHLEDLDSANAMKVFRQHVWGFAPDLVGEQIDAISLLWRMELAGFSAEDQWSAIADHVEPRAVEAFMPFLSAHHVYALARAGRTAAAQECLETVRSRAERDDEEGRRVWRMTGRAVVEASAEFAVGNYGAAAALFDPVIPDLTAIGGSDAQVDLFRQTYLRALQKSGRTSDAASYFERISTGKEITPLDAVLAA